MLTDIEIRKLPIPAARKEHVDKGKGAVRGLRLIVQPSGEKSWAVRYRFRGRNRKLTIGSYPAVSLAEARRRATEALGKIAGGVDPGATKIADRATAKAEQEAEADRVETVARSFFERYVKRNVGDGWGRETERLLRVEILPKLGAKRIGNVSKRHIFDLLDGIVDRGSPITANRTLAALRRMFNWTVERGIIAVSPCSGVKAPAAEKSRDRVLSDDEIKLAWQAFETIGHPFGPIAKLLLLTAGRRDEIASARWSEIDLAGRTITIAKERSKNGVAHEIPLSDAAIEIISGLRRIGDRRDGFLFTTTGRTAVSGFSKAKDEIDAAIVKSLSPGGLDPETVEAPPHWTLHDLRRTAASGMAGLGIPPHVVEAILNHKSGTIKGVAAIYNRYSYASEKRAALDAWSRRLHAIVNDGAPSNVVQLKGRG
jgi:integrase